MTTQLQLKPWVVSRLEGHVLAWVDVKSFRSRLDAEDYMKLLKQMRPDITYQLTFNQPKIAKHEN
jgi:hypothetical protein